MLDLLFVVPARQRHGSATALVSAVLGELHRAGKRTLRSRYHLANEASCGWHRKFGFVEVPDLFVAQHLRLHAGYEMERREQAGGLSEAPALH